MKKITNNKIGRAIVILPIIVMWALFIIVCFALVFGNLLIGYVIIICIGIKNKERAATIVKVMAALTKDYFVNIHTAIAKTNNVMNNFIKTGTV